MILKNYKMASYLAHVKSTLAYVTADAIAINATLELRKMIVAGTFIPVESLIGSRVLNVLNTFVRGRF
jgi:hypothetical protein